MRPAKPPAWYDLYIVYSRWMNPFVVFPKQQQAPYGPGPVFCPLKYVWDGATRFQSGVEALKAID